MGRAGPIPSSALSLLPSRGAFGWAARLCLRFALALWLLQLAAQRLQLELGGSAPGAVGASLGLTALAALALALLGGALGWLLLGVPPAPGAFGAWLRGEPERARDRVVAVVAVLLLLPGLWLAGYFASEAVIDAMAQAHFAAITVVAVHFGLLLLAVALWVPARRWASRLVAGLSRVPLLGAPFATLPRLLLALLALAALAAAAVLWRFWGVMQFLPWQLIVPLAGALSLTVVLELLSRRLRSFAWIEGAAIAGALVFGMWSLVTLDGRSADVRRASQGTLGASAGHALTLWLLDHDGDGHLHVLGGRDCAPYDPQISPVAIDIPENGIDEDCDGADLDPSRLITARRDWPVPERFPRKPPVVLITVDAFAANRMAALGGRRGNTPRIDAFARRGTLFSACFSQGPSTRLSFPSIMTSRWDTQIARELEGKHPFPIADSEVMLAEVLAQAGYQTTAIVSDGYFARRHWKSITSGFARVDESPTRTRGHNSAQVTDAALAALATHRAERPLFLWVHYYDAHSPHVQPEQGPRYGTSRQDLYDAELALVDTEVGRLIAGIDDAFRGQALTVLTADHGIAFDRPRHAKFNYGYDLYSVVLHVPLIFVGPSISVGLQDGAVSTMDVAPTVTNLLRVQRKLPFEGGSLVPELLEGRSARPQRLVHQFYITERRRKQQDPLEMMSLRTERYHLIHDRRVDAYELYDWRQDYYEREELSGSPAAARALAGLRQQLALYTYRLYGRDQKPPDVARKP